jgi:hypothetical protein
MKLLKERFAVSVKHANVPVFYPISKNIATMRNPARNGNAGSILQNGNASGTKKE